MPKDFYFIQKNRKLSLADKESFDQQKSQGHHSDTFLVYKGNNIYHLYYYLDVDAPLKKGGQIQMGQAGDRQELDDIRKRLEDFLLQQENRSIPPPSKELPPPPPAEIPHSIGGGSFLFPEPEYLQFSAPNTQKDLERMRGLAMTVGRTPSQVPQDQRDMQKCKKASLENLGRTINPRNSRVGGDGDLPFFSRKGGSRASVSPPAVPTPTLDKNGVALEPGISIELARSGIGYYRDERAREKEEKKSRFVKYSRTYKLLATDLLLDMLYEWLPENSRFRVSTGLVGGIQGKDGRDLIIKTVDKAKIMGALGDGRLHQCVTRVVRDNLRMEYDDLITKFSEYYEQRYRCLPEDWKNDSIMSAISYIRCSYIDKREGQTVVAIGGYSEEHKMLAANLLIEMLRDLYLRPHPDKKEEEPHTTLSDVERAQLRNNTELRQTIMGALQNGNLYKTLEELVENKGKLDPPAGILRRIFSNVDELLKAFSIYYDRTFLNPTVIDEVRQAVSTSVGAGSSSSSSTSCHLPPS